MDDLGNLDGKMGEEWEVYRIRRNDRAGVSFFKGSGTFGFEFKEDKENFKQKEIFEKIRDKYRTY